ncbi:MAG: sulfatase-like hydrolase/transferase [Actinomycetia bacterium]|nr:sulfatase-like hydrolase/transferase [Actinomycetes bacterium]
MTRRSLLQALLVLVALAALMSPIPARPAAAAAGVYTCSVEVVGGDAVLSFGGDRGVSENLRRDGVWAGGVTGLDSLVVSGGAGSVFAVRVRGALFDVPFTEFGCSEVTPPPEAQAEVVVHISIDGLRPDALDPALTPTLHALLVGGASTLNARNDSTVTRTLPNHTSQLTGRPVAGPSGHGLVDNEDLGGTIHDEAGEYVVSVFDVVHDHGLATGAFVSKAKFDFIDRSWDAANGAPDVTGADDGPDKLDAYLRSSPQAVTDAAVATLGAGTADYVFLHLRNPDEIGHLHTWGGPEYLAAVAEADALVAQVMAVVENDPDLVGRTAVILTSDHGGPAGHDFHDDPLLEENYTIPFIVWGPGVTAGADLYALNVGLRRDPGSVQIPTGDGGSAEPLRGHDVGNLVTQLLGLPAIGGSVYNAGQSLAVA